MLSFIITTHTVHKISGRELDAAICSDTGRRFDPAAEGDVPGDDSGGSLEVVVTKGDEAALEAYEIFKTSGEQGSARSIITGFLLPLANRSLVPFGTYQISYTWG